jgi:hypothetical protein
VVVEGWADAKGGWCRHLHSCRHSLLHLGQLGVHGLAPGARAALRVTSVVTKFGGGGGVGRGDAKGGLGRAVHPAVSASVWGS